ncbi:MAG: AAA family ATPase, partial [Pseudomonadota bacterium]
KYVQSVRRTETESRAEWRAAILALAMQRGYTLVYDEFTRAAPEANAALLSVLEEGVLVATDRAADRSYITAHADFRIILTSNPHDYAGVNGAPDALMDRIVTLTLPSPSTAQIAGIVAARTGLDPVTAQRIAALVDALHTDPAQCATSPMRSAVILGQIAAHRARTGRITQASLAEIAANILTARGLTAPLRRVRDILSQAPAEEMAP